MKIVRIETTLIGAADSSQVANKGEFLVTPLHVFPEHEKLLGEGAVGLRGGPVGAVLVRVCADEGLTGLGSVGVGNGGVAAALQLGATSSFGGPSAKAIACSFASQMWSALISQKAQESKDEE